MIYCLTGTVLSKTPDDAVISCCGVGYRVAIPTSVYAVLAEVGKETTVYTHMNVKEDAVELYGFADEEQLRCFKLLTTVSGVGPRVALAILSLYTPERVSLAIAAGDHKAFTACSGVGPKLAQRLTLELKDKLGALGFAGASETASVVSSGGASETVAALVSLGFTSGEAAAAVSKLPPDLTTEQMVSQALRSLAKRG